jgi:hypothetical protein
VFAEDTFIGDRLFTTPLEGVSVVDQPFGLRRGDLFMEGEAVDKRDVLEGRIEGGGDEDEGDDGEGEPSKKHCFAWTQRFRPFSDIIKQNKVYKTQ